MLAVGFLVGYGWILADQWRMQVVVPGSDDPVILSNYRRTEISIEAFDRKTGKQLARDRARAENERGRSFMSLHAVGNGKAVAWHEDSTLHVVDVEPPHEHRRYVTATSTVPRPSLSA